MALMDVGTVSQHMPAMNIASPSFGAHACIEYDANIDRVRSIIARILSSIAPRDSSEYFAY